MLRRSIPFRLSMNNNPDIIECQHCGLDGKAVPPYVPTTTGSLRIAIVGDSPGEDEVFAGEPFVGRSGNLLRQTLKQLGIDAKQCFITNVMCHRPVDVVDSKDINRKPTIKEIHKATPRLLRELADFKPDRIIICGGVPATALLTEKGLAKITSIRGIWQTIDINGVTVQCMPTYHPAALLRDSHLFDDFVVDLERAVAPEIKKYVEPHCVLVNTYQEALQARDRYIGSIASHSMGYGPMRAVDIETEGKFSFNRALICVGIAPSPDVTVVFTEEGLRNPLVFSVLMECLCDPDLIYIGHNIMMYDAPFIDGTLGRGEGCWVRPKCLESSMDTDPFNYGPKPCFDANGNQNVDISKLIDRWIIPINPTWDTMYMHYALDERKGTHGLKVIGRAMGVNDYDAPLKKYLDKVWGYRFAPRDELYRYLAMDCSLTYSVFEDLMPKMDEDALRLHNDWLCPGATALAEIVPYGVRIDREKLLHTEKKWTSEIEHLHEIMVGIARDYYFTANYRSSTGKPTKEFNPNSPEQLSFLLYHPSCFGMKQVNLRHHNPSQKKDRFDSTDRKVLQFISERDFSDTENDEEDDEDIEEEQYKDYAESQALYRKRGSEFFAALLPYRRLKKMLTTYVRGTLKELDSEDRVYPHVLLHTTETGRTSSKGETEQ